MPLLVDACNVLHVTGVLPPDLAGPDLDELADLIRHSRFSHARTTLVCDGSHRPGRAGNTTSGVRITFSGPTRTADDLIVQAIRKSSDPRRLTVVTSDRAILREARKRRCETLSSEGFLRQLARDQEHSRVARPHDEPDRSDELSAGQVRKWIATFAVTEADLALPPEVEPDAPDPRAAPAPGSPAASSPPVPPPAAPEVPPSPPRKPLLPAALLAEAEALVRAEPTLSTPAPATPAPAEPAPAADPAPPAPPPAARRPADPVIPMELLREAAALEHGGPSDIAKPTSRPAARPTPEPPAVKPPKENILPPDVLAEAEALLRGEDAGTDDADGSEDER